jgi:uncharacterized membrane protein YgdD (TMEM256/DUF423 family)
MAGLLGATAVALGAAGAHGLRPMLMERGMTVAWETAARYHFFHALGLLALAVLLRQLPTRTDRWLGWAGRLWVVGVLLFSGSLYLLALGGPRWLGPITPLGGVALIAGWLLLIVAAFRKDT